MKMWPADVLILLLFCYASLSTGNERVYFKSKNFYNVLHWDPATPTASDQKVLYSVQYRSDADEQQYQVKKECQNITALSCNLTAETPSVHDVHYHARVFANGALLGRTTRFKPLAQTIFGPPILNSHTTTSSLLVNVALPLGPNGVSIADIITSSKNGPIKTSFDYILDITSPKWAAQVKHSTSGKFLINLKNNQTEYCGYVVYKPSTEWGRPHSERENFCVKLPGDPKMLLPWPLMSAALLAAIIIMTVVSLYMYVHGGKKKRMPESLVATSSDLPKVLHPPDWNLIISKPTVCTQSEQIVYATIRAKPTVPSAGLGGYSPQEMPCQPWHGSSGSSGVQRPTSEHQDTSCQSSDIYSSVAAQAPAVENEAVLQVTMEDTQSSNLPLTSSTLSWDEGGKPTPSGAAPLPNEDVSARDPATQLLLHTVRDTNGQLVLPSLVFQLRCTTDGGPSPSIPERKPLLSDLIDSKQEGASLVSLQRLDSSEWLDSGCDDSAVSSPTQPYCNTHFSPAQPAVTGFRPGGQGSTSGDVTSQSGYKQNWIPAIPQPSKDNCVYSQASFPWPWTDPKKEEGGEEEKDAGWEGGSQQILLGGWGLQIQE